MVKSVSRVQPETDDETITGSLKVTSIVELMFCIIVRPAMNTMGLPANTIAGVGSSPTMLAVD